METGRKCAISVTFYEENAEAETDVLAEVRAVMHIDDDDTPHLREVTIRMTEGSEVTSQAISNVDFEMLTRAVSGTVVRTAPKAEFTPQKKSAIASATGGRPYRRMPDPEEVKRVFLDTESVGKLANHYGVPRYTAQAWVDRLRRQGVLKPKQVS